jgi:zinc and cadmium transporter
VSFAAGTLIGAAFLDLIPEALEKGSEPILVYVIVGIIVFFLLEKVLYWYHCHNHHCDAHHKHRVKEYTYLNLVGDALHNMLDGAIIAVSFFADFRLGVATTLAVIFHEIPQEIGDFAILVKGGYSQGRALMMNFFSGLTAILGAVLAFVFLEAFEALEPIALAFAAGGFIYIALVDLLPEIHETADSRKALIEVMAFIVGVIVIGLLHLVNGHT